MIEMLHNMMAIVSRTVYRQGRFLRRQVFDLVLTLMIVGAGILLLLAAMIAGGMTAFALLQPLAGTGGALAIITLFLTAAALAMGVTGYLIQAESDRRYGLKIPLSDKEADWVGKREERPMSRKEAEREKQAYAAWLRAHEGEGRADDRDRLEREDHFGLSAQQIAMAKEYLDMTQDQLDKKLDAVRRHPVTSVGVAAGLGLLLGQSKTARKLASSAVLIGGRFLMDRYLNEPRSKRGRR